MNVSIAIIVCNATICTYSRTCFRPPSLLCFNPMRNPAFLVFSSIALIILSGCVLAQSKEVPKTLFFDSDGNSISNNEFVDIRMANFHYPDATIVRTLEDGTVEFRLQKIPQEGMAAPDIAGKTLDGKKIEPTTLKGKVIVLNFWFIGCASCRAHQPKLNELRAKFAGRDDVIFIAITADPGGEVRKYLTKEKFDYAQIADAEALLKTFRFSGYPKNIVVNKQGEIVYWRGSVHAWDKFESVVRNELGN